MDVTVDPYVSLLVFGERLEQVLDEVDLGVELHVRIDPLSI